MTHGFVVGHEYIDALIDGAVLDDGMVGLGDVYQVAETLFQEVHLQIERPSIDVAIVVLQIGVVVDSLEACLPSVVLSQQPRQR